jgi:eukaryotic-like serine/threonine-protein kinase
MVSGPLSTSRAECPRPKVLLAYAAGKLPTDALDALATHIDSCSVCRSSLEAIQIQDSDPLFAKLRRCVAGGAPGQKRSPEPVREQGQSTAAEAVTVPFRAPAAGPGLPRMFGRYQLLENIGGGGMGIVYKAWHPDLKCLVALKMIRSGLEAGPDERRRFLVEGQAMARLRHEHIVAVNDLNEVDGQHYNCME